MKGGIDQPLAQTQVRSFVTRTAKLNSLSDALIANAASSQSNLLNLLNQETMGDTTYESFWISNSVSIKNATPDLIQRIAELPEVEEIHQEVFIELEPIVEGEEMALMGNVEWGVATVAADKVWAQGNSGEGILVGSIDTGVLVSHESLKDNYVGAAKNGWYDPYDKSATPNDGNGHGTHTMGTIVGTNGIGVAPGAKWLACKGCSSRGCTEAALVGCGQYILCPTDTDGKNKNCALAPHVSSNSWGGGRGQRFYDKVVNAWRAADIVPVFANGNSGPRCKSANSPGDYETVIGVGASTIDNGLASFSSVGPAVSGLVKPDVSAPGLNVRSAWHTGDNAYKAISGTSMACPHTAGVIALMLAKKGTMRYDDIYDSITASATIHGLVRPGSTCGGVSEYDYPNNAFGFGIIHAENAIAHMNGSLQPRPTDAPQPNPGPVKCVWDDNQKTCLPKDKCKKSGWWNPSKCVKK